MIDIIFLLIVGFGCTASFFFWEHYIQTKTTRPPLMRLQLWTRAKGKLATVYMIGCVSWMGFVVRLPLSLGQRSIRDLSQSFFFHATLFYQEVQGHGPIQAMLRFIPCAVSGVLCNVLVAWLVAKVSTQWIICIGLLSTG
jgi:hypothetical protein